jgi:hypothetical protein
MQPGTCGQFFAFSFNIYTVKKRYEEILACIVGVADHNSRE